MPIVSASIAVAAVALDAWLGELPPRVHPLVGFGRYARRVERYCRSSGSGKSQLRRRGALAVMVAVAPWTLVAALAAALPLVGSAVGVVVLYLALGHRSLREHARSVQQALQRGDLPAARRRLGGIVSRDTAGLSADRIAAATVESVLENGNDAVFGALFWFAVAGAPGAVAYRLVNTLDAMWGYRNQRYRNFGWAAARLDDVLNLIPARLTALSYALAGRSQDALRCWHRQARAWDSPNAGPVMAAGAGALGLRLGGGAFYHGAWKARPVLGAGAAADAESIRGALALVLRALLSWLLVLAAIGAAGA